MKEFKHDLFLRLIKAANIALVVLPFAYIWMGYYSRKMYFKPFYNKGNWVIVLLFVVLYTIFGRTYDAFLISLNRISEMIYSQALAAFFADGLLYIVIALLIRRPPNILPILFVFVIQIALSAVWSVLAHKWYFKVFPPKRTAIIYDMREGMEELVSEYGLTKKFAIEQVCSVDECLQNNLQVLKDLKPEAVYLCGVHSKDRNVILKYCVANSITVYVIPRIGDTLMSGARRMHMFHLPVLRVDRYKPSPEYAFLKRLFDIVLSLVAIIVFFPVLVVTAIAIKAEDHGPVLYKQERLTLDGKTFRILKFRSMRVDAENDGIARLSTGDKDNRITKVGHVIRKVRIDELPQLFNILLGDMSIVGPRPERPVIAKQYEQELPEFVLRLQARAGLTGYAQVYGQYNTSPYDKLMMDLMYISHASLLEDARIILATVKILFMPESTEGISENKLIAGFKDSKS